MRFLIARQVSRWRDRLPAQKRNAIDPKDAFMEVFVHLMEKDRTWWPSKGPYPNWAATVIRNCLSQLTDESCHVKVGRNVFRRLAAHKESLEGGDHPPGSAAFDQKVRIVAMMEAAMRTAEDFNYQVLNSISNITQDDDGAHRSHKRAIADSRPGPRQEAIAAEAASCDRAVIRQLLGCLDRLETLIVARRHGLNGQEPISTFEIGELVGLSRKVVQWRLRSAYRKMREYAESLEARGVLGTVR